jgi:hypothetical protein
LEKAAMSYPCILACLAGLEVMVRCCCGVGTAHMQEELKD